MFDIEVMTYEEALAIYNYLRWKHQKVFVGTGLVTHWAIWEISTAKYIDEQYTKNKIY